MIAPSTLPQDFAAWNRRWGAPYGRWFPQLGSLRASRPALKYRGPFAHQTNAETRQFEYPWAYQAVSSHGRALNIVEIGGGLSGMQFVLASEGHSITNVDPGGSDDSQWGFRPDQHAYLARIFNAPVQLIATPLENAGLPKASADVVLCLSVLEHLSDANLSDCLKAMAQVVKPGGIAVITVDLFLDLKPFTTEATGKWGRNVDVRKMLDAADLELVTGNRPELFGFAEFNPATVLKNRGAYLVSQAGSTAQCLIARPRSAEKAYPDSGGR